MNTALTREGCLARQRRLSHALVSAGLDGALVFDSRQIHALSGLWQRSAYKSVLLILADGSTHLAATHDPPASAFVSEIHPFIVALRGTLIDDQLNAALEKLRPFFTGLRQVGSDVGLPPELLSGQSVCNINGLLRSLQRCKLPDEVDLIRAGIRSCESCYSLARRIVEPGMTEIRMFAQLLAAATETAGEAIGEFGNDFQSGTGGGPPRHRPMQAGELLPLDLSVLFRGYGSDLCRTFCVGGQPTAIQRDAHRAVVEALRFAEDYARPGVSCRKLYEEVAAKLDGYRCWSFPHHLGHGIGLSAHESPRLNPDWDDLFQEGDVFTLEPGLYGEDICGGVRLEENYLVTASGITRLSSFPLDL
jgi:Xaa-Pro dipeptidase